MATKTTKVTEARIDALRPDPHNANLGTERGAGMLERSIRENGLGRSVLVDKHGVIVAGNKTVETAVSIGMEDTIVVETDGTKLVVVKRTDLDLSKDEKAKKLALFDNRVSQVNLEFDADVLQGLVAEGIDLAGLWNEDELNALINASAEPTPPDEFSNYDENIDTDYCCPKCGYRWSGKSNDEEKEK